MAQLERVAYVGPFDERARERSQAWHVDREGVRQLPDDSGELVAEAARLIAQQHDRSLAIAQALVVRDEAMALEREAKPVGRLGAPAFIRGRLDLRVERTVDLERVERTRRDAEPARDR